MDEETLRRERVLLGIANQIADVRAKSLSRKRDGKSKDLANHYRKEQDKFLKVMKKLEARIKTLERGVKKKRRG